MKASFRNKLKKIRIFKYITHGSEFKQGHLLDTENTSFVNVIHVKVFVGPT